MTANKNDMKEVKALMVVWAAALSFVSLFSCSSAVETRTYADTGGEQGAESDTAQTPAESEAESESEAEEAGEGGYFFPTPIPVCFKAPLQVNPDAPIPMEMTVDFSLTPWGDEYAKDCEWRVSALPFYPPTYPKEEPYELQLRFYIEASDSDLYCNEAVFETACSPAIQTFSYTVAPIREVIAERRSMLTSGNTESAPELTPTDEELKQFTFRYKFWQMYNDDPDYAVSMPFTLRFDGEPNTLPKDCIWRPSEEYIARLRQLDGERREDPRIIERCCRAEHERLTGEYWYSQVCCVDDPDLLQVLVEEKVCRVCECCLTDAGCPADEPVYDAGQKEPQP